jgi:hypothetical protein
VSGALVISWADFWQRPGGYKEKVYVHGFVIALVGSKGNIIAILINPGYHRVLMTQDQESRERIVANTPVSPMFTIERSSFTPGTIKHLLFVEKHPSVMLKIRGRPGLSILHPDAIDRIPPLMIEVAKVSRKRNQESFHEVLTPALPVQSLDEQIRFALNQIAGNDFCGPGNSQPTRSGSFN